MSTADDYAEIGLPVTTVFTPNQHLAGTQITSVSQHSSGLIYAGTNQGLTEWDGEKWHAYQTANNLPIKTLIQWRDQRVYVGTTNDIGYFERNYKGLLNYQSLLTLAPKSPLNIGEVFASAAHQHGVIFVTEFSLLFWDGKVLHSLLKEKNSLNINAILATETGFIYKRKTQSKLSEVLINQQENEFKFEIKLSNLHLPKGAVITQLINNKENNLIAITHGHGIYQEKHNQMQQQITRAAFGNDVWLEKAIQARDGYYYLTSTYHGLFILNNRLEIVRQYRAQHNIKTKRLTDVTEDVQGNIWLAGTPNIIKLVPPHHYSQYQTSSNSNSAEYITFAHNKITVAGDGLLQLSKANDPFAPASFQNLKSNNKASWHVIPYQDQLIYSEDNGVYALNKHQDNSKAQLILKAVSTRMLAVEPKSKALFALTYEGLFRLHFERNRWFAKLIINTVAEFESLIIDENSLIWAGTATGQVYRIENAHHDKKTVNITIFDHIHGLPDGKITPLKLSNKILFATTQGIYAFKSNSAKNDEGAQFVLTNNLPQALQGKAIHANRIYQDTWNRIWYQLADKNGVALHGEKQNKEPSKERNNAQLDHLLTVFPQTKNTGFVVTNNNILWLTQSNGAIYRADINQLKQAPKQAQLQIRHVTSLTSAETYFSANSDLKAPTLAHEQNSIRLHFALSDHSNQHPSLYRTKLLNGDNDTQPWSPWSTESYKDYTSLAGSDYTMIVEAKDNWQRISQQQLQFEVQPIWYLSGFAWFIYSIFAIALLALSGWATQKWRSQKLLAHNALLTALVDERTQEVQAQAQELKQQQVLKDRFFANVSHEFRTPLTLTITPLKDLLHEQPDLNSDIAYPVETALRNSSKMLDLVSQILDINRLESGQFPLRIAQYDITDLIRQTHKRFMPWAEQHQQTLVVENIDEPLLMYFDQDQIDKCLSNLISNAIKYSGDGCQIEVSLITEQATKASRVGIAVKDNGRGISAEARTKIFDRYFQDKHSEQITEPGTGIGLALVKELMELHQGNVELVDAQLPNKNSGCQFILWLKCGKSHFDTESFIELVSVAVSTAETSQQTLNTAITTINNTALETKNNKADKTTLLVVDDNSELRYFISHKLSSYYRILQAKNGKEGLDLAQKELPDLIISDVMMPIMNGFDMCAAVKNNEQTCTIPVILLTAKSSKRETVEGLQTGADDYLTKPFDTSELIARVAGLINNRKMLRKSLLKNQPILTSPLQQQETFEHKLATVVAKQLADPTFTIDKLAAKLATSRSSLNRKSQQAFQLSAGQYIHQQRMTLALSLIKEQKYSVSEVAYATGFESLAYFSRAFKKYFGESPSTIAAS